ncbi:porin, partial [Salmonella enterica subsp. enterica serovar Infantis]
AEMRGNGNKTYDQNIVGTAVSWTPENWTIAAGGGGYQNFMTTKKVSVNDYFAGDAWGLDYFVGYAFPIGQYAVKAI